MKFFAKLLCISVVLLIACSVGSTDGANFFQRLFGMSSSNSTKSAAGSTTPRTTTTTSTQRAVLSGQTSRTVPTPAGGSSGACWWTQCSSRCASGATVMGANRCETGGYKFNCCSG